MKREHELCFTASIHHAGGILIHGATADEVDTSRSRLLVHLQRLGLDRHITMIDNAVSVRFRLDDTCASHWAPGCDTTRLCSTLGLDTRASCADLEREILLAMLLGPVPFDFPSYDELLSAVRIRRNIVEAARKTALAFHTTQAERPVEYWTYKPGTGFVLLPGKSLITALQKATQPDDDGSVYSFSCYRATEYVILLAVAQELALCNAALLSRLQCYWEAQPIMSGQFHDVFLHEHGSMSAPLPLKYYVPGDRIWFRNPDSHSSDATGYEGSWVMYLGEGLFTNFWKRAEPYTLTAKCLEIFHWRHAARRDSAGELHIDERVVEQRVHASAGDPDDVQRILGLMLRYREPSGVYRDGGCIDTTREYLRWVRPGTGDLVLPPSH
ncbi:MAG TPA: hypothetical protein VGU61_09600 [Noviherbaspirillum sp.]|uniref:hypothetical protein n=1 Tax=Noviherbaspirillum sp. TaxID=1926288 RepID=UPI002DDD71DF|nr:hypothetical protein [Noviherbaspirillum sp.]HEV2610509.1 hypothetical protein [Noviherbaspirillum sp.]